MSSSDSGQTVVFDEGVGYLVFSSQWFLSISKVYIDGHFIIFLMTWSFLLKSK